MGSYTSKQQPFHLQTAQLIACGAANRDSLIFPLGELQALWEHSLKEKAKSNFKITIIIRKHEKNDTELELSKNHRTNIKTGKANCPIQVY